MKSTNRKAGTTHKKSKKLPVAKIRKRSRSPIPVKTNLTLATKLKQSGLTRSDGRAMGCSEIQYEPLTSAAVRFSPAKEDCFRAIEIPYFDLDGTKRDDFWRVRFLDEYIAAGETKPRKYDQPPLPPQLYFCPLLCKPQWIEVANNHEIDIWLTEGEFKAASVCKVQVPCIGLGGVNNWKVKEKSQLIGDFDFIDWNERTVFIVFDSDIETKLNIRHALFGLSSHLVERGARVFQRILPHTITS